MGMALMAGISADVDGNAGAQAEIWRLRGSLAEASQAA
jgi:hypothetical protein